MRTIFCSLVLTVLLAGPTVAQPAAPTTACLVVDDGNFAFEPASALYRGDKETYREYAIAERAVRAGVKFYLRHGHGVVRLEAWIRGKLVAATFFQQGHEPPFLWLAVRNRKGATIEATCKDVSTVHDL
jgi:hypothetical protein